MSFDISMILLWGCSAVVNFTAWRMSPRIPLDKFNLAIAVFSVGVVVYYTYDLIRMVMVP